MYLQKSEFYAKEKGFVVKKALTNLLQDFCLYLSTTSPVSYLNF